MSGFTYGQTNNAMLRDDGRRRGARHAAHVKALHYGVATLGLITLAVCSGRADAQAAPPVFAACSGVSLPRSVVTDIIGPVITGVTTPTQFTINALIAALPVTPPLFIDTNTLLTNAAAGQPVTLSAVDSDGNALTPGSQCNVAADSFTLDTPAGITLGGNRIDGLGANGRAASAGDIDAIALGNGATTAPAATGGVAIGNNASVATPNSVAIGQGATATRGAQAGYAAPGLAATQTSAGEFSVGAPGAERQITNVAAGSAPSDAATVGQVTGAVNAAQAAAPVQFSDPAARTTPTPGVPSNNATLAGANPAAPVGLSNVADGQIAAGSTDAVNGGQLSATNDRVAVNEGAIAGFNYGTAGLVRQVGGAPGAGQITVGGQTGGASVSFAGTDGDRTLGGVAAGVAANDAATVGQLASTGAASVAAAQASVPVQYSSAAAPTTPTPGVPSNNATLVGVNAGAPVLLSNVADGLVAAGSTDAINGGQLSATNGRVAANEAAIGGLTTRVGAAEAGLGALNAGTAGLVRQVGGAPGTGALTVGGQTGGTSLSVAGTDGNRVLTGLAPGLAANDAATVGQLGQVAGGAFNAVQYDTTPGGQRLNSVTLRGGAAGPVTIANVAAGALTPTSTDAVNGAQLNAANGNIAALLSGQAGIARSNNAAGAALPVASGANASAVGFGATATGAGGLALGNGAIASGQGSVALGAGSTDGGAANVISVGAAGAERRVTNVAAGTSGTDAVNVAQLSAATNQFQAGLGQRDAAIAGLRFDLGQVRRRADQGTAAAMAIAGLPQAFTPGASMIGAAIGGWRDQVALAIGASTILSERAVVKAGATFSTTGPAGFNAGIGLQF